MDPGEAASGEGLRNADGKLCEARDMSQQPAQSKSPYDWSPLRRAVRRQYARALGLNEIGLRSSKNDPVGWCGW